MKYFILIITIALICCKQTSKGSAKPEENIDIQELKSLPEFELTNIYIDSMIKFYDTIKSGILIKGTFKIKNIGTKNLKITNIQSGCSCVTINNYNQIVQKDILPRDSVFINFTLPSATESGYISKGILVIGNFYHYYRRLLVEAYIK
ncbi:MAG: DUF1573 domain-containing protein [Chitinophagaceae bacterium]|jgi:hypothetical protein|nr:DUF1573 domain-containing protein [Chitinophagaceae bacterium]